MTGESVSIHPDIPDPGVLARASTVIRSGGVIVYPTETLYGIGADALNGNALRRVYALKGREGAKPLLIIVDAFERLQPLVEDVSADARRLMETFWPGPLTLVFKASPLVSEELRAGTRTLGARVPSNMFCRSLVEACGRPIPSTSANRAGQLPLNSMPDIRQAFPQGVDLFIDAGALPASAPSTVVDVTTSPPRLLRQGTIAWENIERTFR